MRSWKDHFGSTYFKAEDVQKPITKLVIESVEEITIIDRRNKTKEQRVYMAFKGQEKGLILNKTNAARLGDVFGEDMDGWAGKVIGLHKEPTQMDGKECDGVRVVVQKK